MLTLQEYERVFEDFSTRRQEIEALLARDLKQEIAQIDNALGLLKAQMVRVQAPVAPSNGHGHLGIYSGLKSLADRCVACLDSVAGAWLSPKENCAKIDCSGR